MKIKRVDDARVILNQYMKYFENYLKIKKGSGMKQKSQRGGSVIFFNDPKTSKET